MARRQIIYLEVEDYLPGAGRPMPVRRKLPSVVAAFMTMVAGLVRVSSVAGNRRPPARPPDLPPQLFEDVGLPRAEEPPHWTHFV